MVLEKKCNLSSFTYSYIYLDLRSSGSLSTTSNFGGSTCPLVPSTSNRQSHSCKSSELRDSGFSSSKQGCHIFPVVLPGMVQSPFESGKQISRGKSSGELFNKSHEIRRMLLQVRIVVIFSAD